MPGPATTRAATRHGRKRAGRAAGKRFRLPVPTRRKGRAALARGTRGPPRRELLRSGATPVVARTAPPGHPGGVVRLPRGAGRRPFPPRRRAARTSGGCRAPPAGPPGRVAPRSARVVLRCPPTPHLTSAGDRSSAVGRDLLRGMGRVPGPRRPPGRAPKKSSGRRFPRGPGKGSGARRDGRRPWPPRSGAGSPPAGRSGRGRGSSWRRVTRAFWAMIGCSPACSCPMSPSSASLR